MGSRGLVSIGVIKNSTAPATITANSSSADITNHFKNTYGLNIDQKYFANGGDPALLLDSMAGLQRITDELGIDTMNELKLTVKLSSMPSDVYARTSLLSHTIELNSKGYQSYDKVDNVWQSDVKNNFHPTNTTVGGALIHELGHNLDYLVNRRNNPGNIFNQKLAHSNSLYAKAIVQQAFNDLKTTHPGLYETEKSARLGISKYADYRQNNKIKYTETIAEAVADYAQNGNNANPMSVAIWRGIKMALGK